MTNIIFSFSILTLTVIHSMCQQTDDQNFQSPSEYVEGSTDTHSLLASCPAGQFKVKYFPSMFAHADDLRINPRVYGQPNSSCGIGIFFTQYSW